MLSDRHSRLFALMNSFQLRLPNNTRQAEAIKGASHSVYESRSAEVAAQIEAAAQRAQGQ